MSHLYLAHRATRKIAVAFYTIVVRNRAIDAKYPGGMAAFVEKQSPFCNRDIAVCCSMCEEIEEVYQDLVGKRPQSPGGLRLFRRCQRNDVHEGGPDHRKPRGLDALRLSGRSDFRLVPRRFQARRPGHPGAARADRDRPGGHGPGKVPGPAAQVDGIGRRDRPRGHLGSDGQGPARSKRRRRSCRAAGYCGGLAEREKTK